MSVHADFCRVVPYTRNLNEPSFVAYRHKKWIDGEDDDSNNNNNNILKVKQNVL